MKDTLSTVRVGQALQALVPLFALALVLAACGGTEATDDTAAETGDDSAEAADDAEAADADCPDERFTQDEVDAAVEPDHHVVSIYEVPKCFEEEYTLAFINPGKNVPFFQDWSDGMRAAADFYGVAFHETDLQLEYEDTVQQFETLLIQEPDIVGALTTSGPALLARAEQAGIPVIPLDIPIEGNDYFHGIPNEKVGEVSGETLAEAVSEKLSGDWEGRDLTWVAVGDQTCEPCMTRTDSALEAAQEMLDLPDPNVVRLLDTEGLADNAQNAFRDVMTANPDDVFAIHSINDDTGVGPLQAAQAANRAEDILVVTLGASEIARNAIRNDSTESFVGAVDFNPWGEGWTWIEAAIAVGEGEEFGAYDVSGIITSENIDELYPADSE